jgi:hypothetical protein
VLPADFTTGTAAWKILYAPQGVSTNPTYWELYHEPVAVTGSLTGAADTSMTGTTSPSGTIDTLTSFTAGTNVTGLSAGGFARLSLQRNADNAGDTNTDDMAFLGLLLEYTADS